MGIAEMLSEGWEYRGEGNANVAISLPRRQQILRIPKTEKSKTLFGWIIDWFKILFKWNYRQEIEHERRNLDFYNFIMVPFFGDEFAKPAIEIKSSQSIIRKLDKEILPFRPEQRKHKRLQVWSVSLLPDYTLLPKYLKTPGLEGTTFSIEIKPKQGWIPISERYGDKCLFCSNQLLKLNRGQIKKISLYCPLDLFSGEKKRILTALKALLHTPQNNLKIFKNGSFCYGENIPMQTLEQLLCEFFQTSIYNERLCDKFCFLLKQSVLRNFKKFEGFEGFEEEPISKPLRKNKCTFTQVELPENCILSKIFNVQKLNRLGLHKYKDIYNEKLKAKCNIDKWNYVDKLLNHIQQQPLLSDATVRDLNFVPYLLAAVAYDCSFMITLQRLNTRSGSWNRGHIISDGINDFVVNIGVFDLYPKSAYTIMRHVKRHNEILNANSAKS